MFKAELKAETLKSLVYVVSTLVDEVKFCTHEDSVSMKAIDPAHIAMIKILIDKEAFVSYEADESEIGLDLDKVKSIIKLAAPSDIIMMEHDPDQGRLTMTIGNLVRRMSLVETNGMADPRVPQIEVSSSIRIPVEELQKGIRASESISDHLKLTLSPDCFELSCEGDIDLASLKVPASDKVVISSDVTVKSQYPLDFFSNIVKVIPGGTEVELKFQDDYPVMVFFTLADGHVHVNYLLAPRIDNE